MLRLPLPRNGNQLQVIHSIISDPNGSEGDDPLSNTEFEIIEVQMGFNLK